MRKASYTCGVCTDNLICLNLEQTALTTVPDHCTEISMAAARLPELQGVSCELVDWVEVLLQSNKGAGLWTLWPRCGRPLAEQIRGREYLIQAAEAAGVCSTVLYEAWSSQIGKKAGPLNPESYQVTKEQT